VAALSTYVVGLSLTAPAGSRWNLSPQFGDLSSAEGGFTTPLGKFSAGWELSGNEGTLWYNVPSGTTGMIFVSGSQTQVQGDGHRHDISIVIQ
jgi:hypothetical protein